MLIAGWIITIFLIFGTLGLFFYSSQNSGIHKSAAILAIGASALLLTAFFLLPWIRVRANLDTLSNLADYLISSTLYDMYQKLESQGIISEIRRLIDESSFITGWKLATELPTVSIELQMVLFSIPVVAISGLFIGFMSLSGNNNQNKVMGLFLSAISIIAVVFLFFALRRIRNFGIEPGLWSMALDFLGVGVGAGVWFSFIGLLSTTLSGVLIMQSKPSSTKKVQSRPGGRARRTSRRSR